MTRRPSLGPTRVATLETSGRRQFWISVPVRLDCSGRSSLDSSGGGYFLQLATGCWLLATQLAGNLWPILLVARNERPLTSSVCVCVQTREPKWRRAGRSKQTNFLCLRERKLKAQSEGEWEWGRGWKWKWKWGCTHPQVRPIDDPIRSFTLPSVRFHRRHSHSLVRTDAPRPRGGVVVEVSPACETSACAISSAPLPPLLSPPIAR